MGGAPSRILDAPALYLGGVDAFKDESFFTRRGISAVLSVGDEAPPVDWTPAPGVRSHSQATNSVLAQRFAMLPPSITGVRGGAVAA